MVDPHIFLDLRDRRRVFIVGDIHGEYALLKEELEKVCFIPNLDALISVGDLIDRGPDSMAALEWIKQPWFYRVLGNHDIFVRYFLEGLVDRESANKWGGSWFTSLPREELKGISVALDNAPVAMTVLTPGGKRIGIVHADCCQDWNRQISEIKRTWVSDMSLFSRETIESYLFSPLSGIPFNIERARVANIDHVFHGHTITEEPLTLANRSWIDTGAYKTGQLTLVDVDVWLDRLAA